MLKVFYKLRELDFYQLMQVYSQGNIENARELYSDFDLNVGRIKAEDDFYQYLAEDFFRQPGAFYCVWVEQGQYVSALRLEPYSDGLLLEALETHPEHRRKGYAAALIRSVQEYLEEQGTAAVYSHVSKRNTASLAVHSSCGFREYLDRAVYVDGTVTNRACTLRWAAGYDPM